MFELFALLERATFAYQIKIELNRISSIQRASTIRTIRTYAQNILNRMQRRKKQEQKKRVCATVRDRCLDDAQVNAQVFIISEMNEEEREAQHKLTVRVLASCI